MRQELSFVRKRMAEYANTRRIEGPTFEEGDMVYLIRRNIKTRRPSNKLDFKKLGPFKIKTKVSDPNYRLELPKTMRIHPVFHASLLEPAPRNAKPDTTAEIEDEEPEYEVESILDSRSAGNNIEYLIKWKEYPHEENTWEPKGHLVNCQERPAVPPAESESARKFDQSEGSISEGGHSKTTESEAAPTGAEETALGGPGAATGEGADNGSSDTRRSSASALSRSSKDDNPRRTISITRSAHE